MVVFILCVVVVILLVVVGYLVWKIRFYKSLQYEHDDMFLYYRNKLSMVEYYYRNYKEGENPYTVLRKLGDLLYDTVLGGDKIEFK